MFNSDISLVVMKYCFMRFKVCCCCVDPHRKIPITCSNTIYFREKGEGMLLQVKLSLTVKSKIRVTVGWFLLLRFVVCLFSKKHLYIEKVKSRKHYV